MSAPTHALVRVSRVGGGVAMEFWAVEAVIFAGSAEDCVRAAHYEPDRDGYTTEIVKIERSEP